MLRLAGKVFRFAFVVMILGAGRTAWCARPDAVTATTAAGSGLILQSLMFRKHLPVPKTANEQFFAHRRMELEGLEPPRDPDSSIAIEGGYSFGLPSAEEPATATAPSGSMMSHSGALLLEWEASPRLDLQVHIGADFIPSQYYGHGQLGVRLETFIPLAPMPKPPEPKPIQRRMDPDDEIDPDDRLDALAPELIEDGQDAEGKASTAATKRYDPSDARSYYMKQQELKRRRRMEIDDRYLGRYRYKTPSNPPSGTAEAPSDTEAGAVVDNSPYPHVDDDEEPPLPTITRAMPPAIYPHLTVAGKLRFDENIHDSALANSAGVTSLSQFSAGLDVGVGLSADARLYASGVYSSYSDSVTDFVATLPTAKFASVVVPSGVLAAFQPAFLAFPAFVFEEGLSYDPGEAWNLTLGFNQVLYEQAGAGLGLGFSGAVNYALSRHWGVGLGGSFTTGGPASGALLGLFNLSYLF